MANSFPVVFASDQSALPVSIRDLNFNTIDVSGSTVKVEGRIESDPIVSIASSSSAYIVSTTAIRLAGINVARRSLIITNNGPATLFLGNTSGVTTSGNTMGIRVPQGASYSDSGFGVFIGETWGIYSIVATSENVSVSDRY